MPAQLISTDNKLQSYPITHATETNTFPKPLLYLWSQNFMTRIRIPTSVLDWLPSWSMLHIQSFTKASGFCPENTVCVRNLSFTSSTHIQAFFIFYLNYFISLLIYLLTSSIFLLQFILCKFAKLILLRYSYDYFTFHQILLDD